MKECMKCGTKFVPQYRLKNYCSDKCKPHHEPTEFEIQESIHRNKEKSRRNGIIPIDERHYTCLHCNVSFQKQWPPKKGNIFCSRSCSSTYRFSKDEERKRLSDIIKKSSIEKRGFLPTKKESPRHCISCSLTIKLGKYCNECKKFAFSKPLFEKLEINESLSLKERGAIAKEFLMDLYYDKRMSMLDIQREHKVNMNTLHKFAKKTGFSLRTISEGAILAYSEGRGIIGSNQRFKQGWHTTWEGKQVYYRSSYEQDVCRELDEKHVPYEMESLRITYYDSQKKQMRTALPDFHLSDSNEIVEVKSVYFFNKINMQDKFREYVKLGYRCKLVLEHREYSVAEVMAM